MIYEVLLEKVSDNINKLRTQKVSGFTENMPCPGESFHLEGESLTEGEGLKRYVTTSPVRSVAFTVKDGEINGAEFKTLSGTLYRLEVKSITQARAQA